MPFNFGWVMNCYDLCCMRSHALLLKRSFKKVDHTKICNVAMPELELKPKSFYISPAVSYLYLWNAKYTHLAPTESCLFVWRVLSGGMLVSWPTCCYLWKSPCVVAPLHELPCGGLFRDAGPLIQYYTGLKQDCSTSLTLPQAIWSGKERDTTEL